MSRRVYFAAPLGPDHTALRELVLDALIAGDVQVVTDAGSPRHRPPGSQKLKFSFPGRVDRILDGCGGIVVLLPAGGYRGSPTSSPMFYEILLAARHRLPMLCFTEEGLALDWSRKGDLVTAAFGHGTAPNDLAITPEDISLDATEDRIFNARLLQFPIHAYSDGPIELPRHPSKSGKHERIVRDRVNAFLRTLIDPEVEPYAFFIGPFQGRRVREIVTAIAEDVAGIPCRTGSDQNFAPETIQTLVTNARFVIADLSTSRPACIYETGLAIGSGRHVLVLHKGNPRLPFGAKNLDRIKYDKQVELGLIVRDYSTLHAPLIFNRRRSRIVILLHGIRTRAGWQEMIEATLNDERTRVVPVKYGFLDLIGFWFPFWTRRRVIEIIKYKLLAAERGQGAGDLVVIAHSFGTYALAKVLAEVPQFRPDRVVLCGSIIPDSFRWNSIVPPPMVVNDCSTKDIFPVLAAVTSWGYGRTGTFGFGSPGVEDRFHDLPHSGYLERSFVERYWLPFVRDGVIERSPYPDGGRRAKWWLSAISGRFVLVAFVTIVLLIALMVVI